ncbi:MAG: AI-2E family transporter [Candidatus Gracilibacteria bacterium]|nr:AI-2E family transporter [Candidatus Gracilibacteria bacterium]
MKVPYIFKLIFNKFFFQKIFAIALLISIAYYLQQFFVLFLITFLFAYLFLNLGEFLSKFFLRYIEKIHSRGWKNFLKAFFSVNSIVLSLYILFIGLIIFAVSDIIPKIIDELSNLPKTMPFLADQVKTVLIKLEELKNFKQDIQGTLTDLLTQSNYEIVMKFLGNLKSVGLILVEFIISLILSYVFIIDRVKIRNYFEEIKKGNFAFLYNEYEIIFSKIANGFGMIFKAQSIISFVNTVLTIFGLYVISFVHGGNAFPYIFTLAILVFIFGFIPVLGLFLSSIPILAIGFSYGGLTIVFEILLMISIIHMIEAYYLNPRIVSSYMEMPISLTFLVLIMSEQLFGLVGMLIGMPVFYIILDILKDFDSYISKVKGTYSKISDVKKETQNNISSGIRLSRSGKKSEI